MTTVAAGIKGLLSGARTVAGLVKKVESSDALQARFDESAAEVHREITQVSFAVCKALVAHALRREPSHDEVNDFLSAAVNDPAFPNRAFRLLGEARKSASRHRRAFLASVLFGLPFGALPEDERDRVDMVVERLMPGDVELLKLLVEKDRAGDRMSPEQEGPYGFGNPTLVAAIRRFEVMIIATDDGNVAYADPVEEGFRVDDAAFSSLRTFGLIDIGESKATSSEWEFYHLVLTPLGLLTMQAIDSVRAGFDASPGGVP